MPERTEADAVAALVHANDMPHTVEIHEGTFALRTDEHERWTMFDEEPLLPNPRRSHGAVVVNSAASFIEAVKQRQLADTAPTLYADEELSAMVAVLNDDFGAVAGWRDYTVVFGLRFTPEWKRWTTRAGLVQQERFAEFIEDGLEEIVDPPAATMLELAQSFQATVSAKFRQGSRLQSGARQLTYEEDVSASAGAGGSVEIPEKFKLAIRPFYGAKRYGLEARLKYRLAAGHLSIGYSLIRPDDVVRTAFGEVVVEVSQGLDLTALDGPGPQVSAGVSAAHAMLL